MVTPLLRFKLACQTQKNTLRIYDVRPQKCEKFMIESIEESYLQDEGKDEGIPLYKYQYGRYSPLDLVELGGVEPPTS